MVDRLSALARASGPWLAMGLLLAALVFAARDGVVLMVLAVIVAGFLLFVVALGLERAGRWLVVLGFFVAPWSAVVLPMATFVTFADVFFAMGFGLLLPSMLLSRTSLRVPMLYTVGAIGSLSLGLLASLLVDDSVASLGMFARFVAGVLIVPLVFMVWKPPVRVIGHLAMAYALGTCASIGYGVTKGGERPGTRFIGMTEHPNILGITGLLGLALIPFIWTRIKPHHRWFWLGVAAVNAAAVWFSGSRAALVVAIAVVLMWPVIERSLRGGAWMLLVGAVGVLVADQFFSVSGDSALARLMGGGSSWGSDAERSNLLRHYWHGFLERPLTGNGFEEAVLGHNVYLQVAFSMGVFGLIAFVLVLLAGAISLFTSPRPLHRLAYPVVAYAMIAMITSVIWDRYIWAPLALAFAAQVLDRSQLEDEDIRANLLSAEPDPAAAGRHAARFVHR
ncbi:hypothetical protein [Nocardioides sp. AE5]|uniref:O-antigen ligase family protein n=1 Tax=Nocardioides sp. AE5 TaxID=2962573 RepID=UPI002880E2E3|nr:hypothetical protein [Nocardioides sp. AE5]MDT0202594.1 hypothetical protein [Nocardioides sp. AE5]